MYFPAATIAPHHGLNFKRTPKAAEVSGKIKPFLAFDDVDLSATAKKGWTMLKGQNYNAASLSANMKTGSRQFRRFLGTEWTKNLSVTAGYVGLAAAGLRAVGGVELLFSAVKEGNVRRGLDGVRDLGSAAVLGLASAGKFALYRTVFPITTAFNTVRGAFNFAAGWKNNDKARRSQGALDTVRSLGQTARALKRFSPLLGTAGLWLAPVAGGMQAHQGWKNLTKGIVQNKNRLELKGLVDIASAAAITMIITGIGAAPGLAIFTTVQTIHTAYTMSKTVRKYVDKGIDKLEPAAHKGLKGLHSLGSQGREMLSKLGGPFPKLLAPKVNREQEGTGTSRRLEEDSWETYVAMLSETEPQKAAEAELLEDPATALA